LRTQLLNKALVDSNHTPAGTLTNDQIFAAMKERRIIIDPPPDVRDVYENGVDVKLDTRFMKLPKGEHTDFSDPDAAKAALKRWAAQGREMEYPNGITLAPGEKVLGFTDKTITLPRVPQRLPDGTMPKWTGAPIRGDINQKSSNARNFLTNHETAPALNNNSTAHKVVLEISNNSDNVVTLRPSISFGSIQLHELGAFPAETEGYKVGSLKGQHSLAGHDGVHSSLAYYPVDGPTTPASSASLGTRLWRSLSLFDDPRSTLNGPPMETPVKPPINYSLDYSSMTPWEQLRYRPDLQGSYAHAMQLKLAQTNSLTDHDILKTTAPELLPGGS
jgi:deoxycytidine triphosphate deaminase